MNNRLVRPAGMDAIYDLDSFYRTSLGQYCLAWEQNEFDKLVSDCFGYNALQLGASSIDFLRNNRIALKIAGDREMRNLTHVPDEASARVRLQPETLPFESESIDLVLLPHTLELAEDPHSVLRETARVLIPGGRVILTGFNLASLWGLRVGMQKFGLPQFLPARNFMTIPQIRDWLQLLSFNVDRGAFGRYGWYKTNKCARHPAWIEKAGDRWWPQCGSLFALSAVKTVNSGVFVGKVLKKNYFFAGAKAGVKSNKQAVKE